MASNDTTAAVTRSNTPGKKQFFIETDSFLYWDATTGLEYSSDILLDDVFNRHSCETIANTSRVGAFWVAHPELISS